MLKSSQKDCVYFFHLCFAFLNFFSYLCYHPLMLMSCVKHIVIISLYARKLYNCLFFHIGITLVQNQHCFCVSLHYVLVKCKNNWNKIIVEPFCKIFLNKFSLYFNNMKRSQLEHKRVYFHLLLFRRYRYLFCHWLFF